MASYWLVIGLGVHVGKDLSPAAPLPYVDRRRVAHIGCAAVARV